jgi:hypothetical protein
MNDRIDSSGLCMVWTLAGVYAHRDEVTSGFRKYCQ